MIEISGNKKAQYKQVFEEKEKGIFKMRTDRYKVFTGTYTPEGTWDEQSNLMDYKHAANYAAKIAKEAPSERITVWDTNQVVVTSDGGRVNYTTEMGMDREWSYVATAIANAIESTKK